MTAVRGAVVGDAEAIARVHVETWQAAYVDDFDPDFLAGLNVERRTEWWAEQIAAGREVIVATVDDTVVGFCNIGPARQSVDRGEIYAIYVSPSVWSDGHGHALFNEALARAATLGFVEVELWVLGTNRRARDFYERQGMMLAKPIRIEEIGGRQVTEVCYRIDSRSSV